MSAGASTEPCRRDARSLGSSLPTRDSLRDRFGAEHRSTTSEAASAFEVATLGVAAHRPCTAQALADALAADPHLTAAHALKGLAQVTLARAELAPVARQAHADALASAHAKGGLTPTEQALTEALGLAVEGRLMAAADRLDQHLAMSPREFLPAKMSHALRFMSGDLDGMLRGTSRIVARWDEGDPGYGFLLGCHAFALEETGDLAAAERTGRRAVALEPTDAWGLHAVSHVHEMQGRTDEGIAWLTGARPVWSACNNFSFHMAWHLALFHLERGDHDSVLAVYDSEVRPQSTDDFRDMANAVSLLWRLQQEGVRVGHRWDELRSVALKRRQDTTLTFACLHNLLALVATGETAAARELVDAMARGRGLGDRARRPADDQALVVDSVGRELGELILSLADGESVRRPITDPGAIARGLQRIGGSHAQRDVFLRTIAAAAADRHDLRAFDQVMAVRRSMKRDDRFAVQLQARLDGEPLRLSA